MGSNIFSPMAIDAIGEIFNISLGSSATAVSNMLARRVDITTPTVTVVAAQDFSIDDIRPAIGVKIDYVAGLHGSNVMLLKRTDVRAIVDILMGMQTTDEEFEINDLNLSAISEVMNQMMGAASTAMSDFLGEMVNISTPEAFEIKNVDELIDNYFPDKGILVIVRFKLSIEDAVESEFMSALEIGLVRNLLKGFGISGEDVGEGKDDEFVQTAHNDDSMSAASAQVSEPQVPASQPEQVSMQQSAPVQQPEPAPAQQSEPSPVQQQATPAQQSEPSPVQQQTASVQQQPTPVQQPAQAQQPMMQQPMMQQPMMQQPMMMPDGQQYAGMQMPYPPYPYPPMYYMPQQQPVQEPKTIQTKSPTMSKLEKRQELNVEQEGNLDLLMSVPVDIAVEIGRTRRRVKDILNYTKGSLVVLDRLAGDRADLYVNGKCIAKGDIVVVDDSFGLRIAEIVEPLALEDL